MHKANHGNTLSVAMCTFNAGEHLAAQLESIQSQTRAPDELVVCDDGSTDGTWQSLQAFAAQAPFPVRLHANPRRLGPAKNFERCIGLCTGGVIFTCDQDDIWHPHKLKTIAEVFDSRPDTLLAFSDLNILLPDGRHLHRTQWQLLGFSPARQQMFFDRRGLEVLLKFNVVTGTAMAFRKTLADMALPVPQGSLHDEWLALVAAVAGNLQPVSAMLVDYRQHGSQAVGAATTGFLAQLRHARNKMQLPYFRDRLTQVQTLLDRIESGRVLPADRSAVKAITSKRDFCQARIDLRKSLLKRWPIALTQLLKTNYHRFGYGVRSFAQDLFL